MQWNFQVFIPCLSASKSKSKFAGLSCTNECMVLCYNCTVFDLFGSDVGLKKINNCYATNIENIDVKGDAVFFFFLNFNQQQNKQLIMTLYHTALKGPNSCSESVCGWCIIYFLYIVVWIPSCCSRFTSLVFDLHGMPCNNNEINNYGTIQVSYIVSFKHCCLHYQLLDTIINTACNDPQQRRCYSSSKVFGCD